MVRIMGIVGSPRKEGNTENLIKEALKAAGDVGAEIELVRLGSAEIEPVWLVIYAKPLVNVPYTMIWEKYWKKNGESRWFYHWKPGILWQCNFTT